MSTAARKIRSAPKPGSSKRKNRKLQPTKLDQIAAALQTRRGATIADLMALTGWQVHSVRGAMAGALKKQRGLKIVSEKTGAERIYRIAGPR